MNYFLWKDRNCDDLKRFKLTSALELSSRIVGFPDFVCYESSGMSKCKSKCAEKYLAYAHTHLIFGGDTFRNSDPTWIVEFNDFISDLYDMDVVLYHELAHFMSDSISYCQQPHGLLWATCCDALNIIMDMDCVSLAEGTDFIFQASDSERRNTFEIEEIPDQECWHSIRLQTRSVLAEMISKSEMPILYCDLLVLISFANKMGRRLAST